MGILATIQKWLHQPTSFERYTDRARKALLLANEATIRQGLETIGPEQMLLGLLAEGSGVGFAALNSLHIDVKSLAKTLEARITPGPGLSVMGRLPLSRSSKEVVDRSRVESIALGDDYVGTEHLCLALSETASPAAEAMTQFGATHDRLRTWVLLIHADRCAYDGRHQAASLKYSKALCACPS